MVAVTVTAAMAAGDGNGSRQRAVGCNQRAVTSGGSGSGAHFPCTTSE